MRAFVYGAVCCAVLVSGVGQAAPTLRFSQLTIEDGLSVSGVSSVLQDRQGFMWFGTQDGLNRYDGHRVEVIRPIPFDRHSLSDPMVYALAEDADGALWASTLTGLDRRDPQTGRFSTLPYAPDDPAAPAGRSGALLAQDGVLWLGTLMLGLDRYDIEAGRFQRYRHAPDDPNSLSSDGVTALHRSSDGQLWVGTVNGLNALDDAGGAFERHLHDDSRIAGDYNVPDLKNNYTAPAHLRASIVTGMADDPQDAGVLWITTQAGLVRLDRASGATRHFTPQSADAAFTDIVPDPAAPNVFWLTTMSSGLFRFNATEGRFDAYRDDDEFVGLYTDRSGLIWVIGFFSSIDRFNPAGLPFQHERHDPDTPGGLSDNSVWGFAEGSDGRIWVSTQHGLNLYDPSSGTYEHFYADPADPGSVSSDHRFAMLVDSNGVLWAGTRATGIDRLDPGSSAFRYYVNDPTDESSLSAGTVFTLFETRDGTIWVGTSRGLNHYDERADRFRRVPIGEAVDRGLPVLAIHEDAAANLWVGTPKGLRYLDRETGEITIHRYSVDDRTGLNSDAVNTIVERAAEPGILWLGTAAGLNRFDTADHQATHVTADDGLPGMHIYGLLEDERGHLWMSTNSGIADFSPDTGDVVAYGPEAGVQSREFNQSAYLRSRTGVLYFGGVNGFNRFAPAAFSRNEHPPEVILTGLRLLHQPVVVGEGLLEAPLWETREIELAANHRSVTFEFAELHYLNPRQNNVRYHLAGFDEDWVDPGRERQATYTNLAPGKYEFRVRAANADNIWNEEAATLSVLVRAPWYQAQWAHALWILLLVSFIAALGWIVRRRITADDRARAALEARVRERTAQLEEANRGLESFSYSVSHDLRSPLRAIEGYSQILLDDHGAALNADARRYLVRVQETALQMAVLIDDLLAFSRVGRRENQFEVIDVAQLVRAVCANLAAAAPTRDIQWVIGELPPCVGDLAMVRQVFENLIGNAIKYSRRRAQAVIEISGVSYGHRVRYSVSDNGAGFDPAYTANLFGVFQRLHSDAEFEGTGIGLAIVKRIVERHGGEVSAEGVLGEGATFSFTLPASS